VRSGATFDVFLGSESTTSVGAQQFFLGYGGNSSVVQFGFTAFSASLNATATTAAGHWLGVNQPSTAATIYRNGVQDSATTGAVATPTSSSIFVFALNRAALSSASDGFSGRLGAYSIGVAMTATQASAYYAALQAFQTALGRNV
jgi:hypothetical protein